MNGGGGGGVLQTKTPKTKKLDEMAKSPWYIPQKTEQFYFLSFEPYINESLTSGEGITRLFHH